MRGVRVYSVKVHGCLNFLSAAGVSSGCLEYCAVRCRKESSMPSFDEILKICNRYQSIYYYVYPGIPEKKLAKARNSYHIPDAERVAALLIDGWGTGTDGLAVARNGLYWHSVLIRPDSSIPSTSSISWEELAEVSIVKKERGLSRDIVFSDRKAFTYISTKKI